MPLASNRQGPRNAKAAKASTGTSNQPTTVRLAAGAAPGMRRDFPLVPDGLPTRPAEGAVTAEGDVKPPVWLVCECAWVLVVHVCNQSYQSAREEASLLPSLSAWQFTPGAAFHLVHPGQPSSPCSARQPAPASCSLSLFTWHLATMPGPMGNHVHISPPSESSESSAVAVTGGDEGSSTDGGTALIGCLQGSGWACATSRPSSCATCPSWRTCCAPT